LWCGGDRGPGTGADPREGPRDRPGTALAHPGIRDGKSRRGASAKELGGERAGVDAEGWPRALLGSGPAMGEDGSAGAWQEPRQHVPPSTGRVPPLLQTASEHQEVSPDTSE